MAMGMPSRTQVAGLASLASRVDHTTTRVSRLECRDTSNAVRQYFTQYYVQYYSRLSHMTK